MSGCPAATLEQQRPWSSSSRLPERSPEPSSPAAARQVPPAPRRFGSHLNSVLFPQLQVPKTKARNFVLAFFGKVERFLIYLLFGGK